MGRRLKNRYRLKSLSDATARIDAYRAQQHRLEVLLSAALGAPFLTDGRDRLQVVSRNDWEVRALRLDGAEGGLVAILQRIEGRWRLDKVGRLDSELALANEIVSTRGTDSSWFDLAECLRTMARIRDTGEWAA